MQDTEFQQRFSDLETSITKAVQACDQVEDVPQQLKDVLSRLESQYRQVRDQISATTDEQFAEIVASLEQLGDEAKKVANEQPKLAQALHADVITVHDKLSQLKHALQ